MLTFCLLTDAIPTEQFQLCLNFWFQDGLKMDHSRPILRLFSSFQTNFTILPTNKCKKMSIQYMVLGFELTTFGT